MSKDMAFYSKETNYHTKFSKLSGIMQFPVVPKKSVKEILSEEEYKYFAEKMKDYENKNLLTEDENSYTLTKDGVFWGNNLSSDIIIYILEKIFHK